MVNPAGTWTYYYDADGRYTSMSSPAGTSHATYLDNGWESTRTLPTGTVTTYSRNALGLLTELLNQTSGSATLSDYSSFSYDGVFNPTGLTASVPGATSYGGATTWSLDSKDRLTQESTARFGGVTDNFAVDDPGNLTTFKGSTQTFNSDNQQTGTGFSYDGNGNPTTYRTSSASFDPLNRLTSLGSGWTAGYRADGLRAWKNTGSAATFYLYDGGEPVVEMNSSGTVTGINVFAPDGLVARKQGGSWIYYTFDAQGSVSQRLNSSEGVLSNSAYDAFGVEHTTGSPTDTFGYNARSGYILDRENGLYLCQHRYYDPGIGRWLNRDPIGYGGGIGLYGYCGEGPVDRSDPTGKVWADKAGAAAILAGMAASNPEAEAEAESAFEKAVGAAEPAADEVSGLASQAGQWVSDKCQLLQDSYQNLLKGAQQNYPNLAGKIQQHHNYPVYLGGPKDGPLTPLDAAYHQEITNEFRSLWGYGQLWPDEQTLEDILKKVYDKWPLP